jgi:hypothetical protein
VRYAYATRKVTPTAHPFSSRNAAPDGLTIIVILHWGQFLALFRLGSERADFSIRLKDRRYRGSMNCNANAVLLFEVRPYLEELARTLRYRTKTNKLHC